MGRSSNRKVFRQTLGAALCTDLDVLARTVHKHGVAMQFLLSRPAGVGSTSGFAGCS